jgi:hypothetical protein
MLQHIIITPFSYRRIDYQPDIMPDPLNPRILKKRFECFEMTTLPSLIAQDFKNFTWIIVVDKKLPEAYRRKFETVTAGMKNVFLHNFTAEVIQNSLTWMKSYVHAKTEYLINSELDADDAVFRGFTKYAHEYFMKQIDSGRIQPLHFLVCKNVLQWDFFYTSKAPLGFIKPWTRAKTPTVSAGLTACCKYPEMDISIVSFDHRFVGFLFLDKNQNNLAIKDIEAVKLLKNTIKKKSESGGINWDGEMCSDQNFHQVLTNEPQVLITNNFLNDRFVRVFEDQEKREVFNPQTLVPGIEIDYDLAARLIKANRKILPLLAGLLWKFLFEKNYVKISSKKPKLTIIKRLIRGFRNMK